MSTLKVDTIDTPDSSGNITVSRPLSGSGASLTSLPAANLTGTLPAISGANLTALNATELTSGTLPMARLSGTLPALNGSALTALNGSNISSGTLPTARLGTGKILQVVSEQRGMYNQNTTSTTEQDVEYSSGNTWEMAITPSATSSYLWITGVYGVAFSASNTQNRYNLKPYIKIGSGSYAQMLGNYTTGYYHSNSAQYGMQASGLYPFHIKFSPNTTSECKIKLTYRVQHSGYGASITINPHTGGETRMTVMEVSG